MAYPYSANVWEYGFSEVRIAPVLCRMDCVCGWEYRGYPSKY